MIETNLQIALQNTLFEDLRRDIVHIEAEGLNRDRHSYKRRNSAGLFQ